MTDTPYERYKESLRTGHVAAGQGRHADALAAYAEASEIAPERPLPHASRGTVLLKLDRVAEALDAYGAALACAPRDEAALAGRAEALIRAGRPAEAAGALDLLAETWDLTGRLVDACATTCDALELAESRARRRHLEGLVGRLRSLGEPYAPTAGGPATPAAVEELLARATGILEGPAHRAAEAEAERAAAVAEPGGPGSGGLGPGALPEIDPVALAAAVDDAIVAQDRRALRRAVLAAVEGFGRTERFDAALDACATALAFSPADPEVHLALAELYLQHGWRGVAIEKLLLLDRFVDLTDDRPARARLREAVERLLPDEPRLAGIRS
jgi:tetratricopeptide (TPR) repeat protein